MDLSRRVRSDHLNAQRIARRQKALAEAAVRFSEACERIQVEGYAGHAKRCHTLAHRTLIRRARSFEREMLDQGRPLGSGSADGRTILATLDIPPLTLDPAGVGEVAQRRAATSRGAHAV